MEQEKTFFIPGDRVICVKVNNSPEMYVLHKKELTFKDRENKDKILQGIVCRWFTDDGMVQEALFNTKDLQKL